MIDMAILYLVLLSYNILRHISVPIRRVTFISNLFSQMVLQFSDSCIGCESTNIKQKELERFVQKYRALTSDEISVALMATSKEIFNLLAQLVPCVGCRRRYASNL